MSFAIYEVYNPEKDVLYCGYTNSGNPLDAFWALVGKGEPGPVQAAGPDVEISVISRVEHEEDAVVLRNKHRLSDPRFVSGPIGGGETVFRTARDAYAAGAMSYVEVKALEAVHPREQIVADLDSLTLMEFQAKYNISEGA